MTPGSLPSCQDFQKRFDLFFDGEMDGRGMRELALHVARCRPCEEELRQAERFHEWFSDSIRSRVDGFDAADLWRSIEARVEAPQPSLAARLRERWEQRFGLEMRFLTLAASAALILLAIGALWPAGQGPDPARVANNEAYIDSLDSSAPAVGVWSEPYEHTTAIFVSGPEP